MYVSYIRGYILGTGLECNVQSKCGLEEYFHRLGLRQQYIEVLEKGWDSASEYHRALVAIWNVLCDTPLFGVFIEEGVFYHLGTSRELYELQTAPLLAEESLDMRRILPLLRAQYNLVPSISSIHYTTCCTENTCTINNKSDITTHNFGGVISINSSIGLCPCAVLGRGVVIENSVLFGRCNIGNGSVISDIQPTLGYALSVPPDTMIQQVPLLVDRECLGEEFVLIVLGAADNIKECDIENITLCGMKITYMMQCGDLSKSDIWDDDSESSLWTAKLFPVVTCDMVEQYDASELMNILGWFMQGRCDVDSTMTRRAALVWKACRRVALSDLLRMGNAMLLLHWKLFLSALTVNGSSLVTQYNCENSLAPTSPHNRTNDFSTVFRAANDSLLRAVRIIDREMSEVVSLFLALGYLRLCREESYSFADDSAMSCLHDERYLNHLDLHRFRSVLAEYDAMWARVASCGLIPLMNDYFIAMVDFYSPSSVLITVLNRVSTVIVRESQYPRLLLLYERLRSKRVLTGINEGSTCHSSLSRDLFKDNVLQCLEDGRVNIRRALDFMFARIHEYAMKDSVCAVDRDECDPWDIVWMAQVIIRYHLQMSNLCGASFKFAGNVAEVMGNYDRVCVAQSPVRVDLAGGWSDTAPISYEYPGAVLNVAIDIDLKCPLRCACRIIPTAEIKMVSYTVSPLEFAQTGLNTSQFETETSTSVDVNDFDIFNRISRSETSVIPSCVLIKACIVVAKVVDVRLLKSESNTVSFEHFLRDSYGGGIEIATCSLIPSGSGVGGSSILAGVVLQSLIRLLNPSCEITPDILVAMVSQVEQLLTTGGGWQDQVGGIYGGIKMCRSNGNLPMTVAVSPIALPDQLIARLEERMLVIYTGVQRLARNTLINALSTHAVFPLVNMKTSVFNNMSGVVPNLINTAENIDKLMRRYIINYDNSVEEADHVIDLLAAALNSYWAQKKDIASGSETPYMSLILREVSRVCCGVSACGAGAGGFIACILAPEYGKSCMEKVIDDLNASSSHCVLTVHDVRVNNHGVDGSTIDLACKHSIEDALFDHKIDHVV
mmetsp:Transcript_9953/g.15009  ORF Transcript_9953/g.15009 Transcript_9953/m.15009 type:complete len:1065 (-) Transcript_9953:76-3270(-)